MLINVNDRALEGVFFSCAIADHVLTVMGSSGNTGPHFKASGRNGFPKSKQMSGCEVREVHGWIDPDWCTA